jgi:hypothetical protein
MFITGKNFAKAKNNVKNNPNVNKYVPTSTQVGEKSAQLEGK